MKIKIDVPTLLLLVAMAFFLDLIYLPFKNGHLVIPEWAVGVMHDVTDNDDLYEAGIDLVIILLSLLGIGYIKRRAVST